MLATAGRAGFVLSAGATPSAPGRLPIRTPSFTAPSSPALKRVDQVPTTPDAQQPRTPGRDAIGSLGPVGSSLRRRHLPDRPRRQAGLLQERRSGRRRWCRPVSSAPWARRGNKSESDSSSCPNSARPLPRPREDRPGPGARQGRARPGGPGHRQGPGQPPAPPAHRPLRDPSLVAGLFAANRRDDPCPTSVPGRAGSRP